MNVMNYKQENAGALVSVLSMLSVGTKVIVEVDNYTTICYGRIEKPKNVLDLCKKCYNAYGHHPRVYEISIVSDYNGSNLLFRCV